MRTTIESSDMKAFEWDGLKPGDQVYVHEAGDVSDPVLREVRIVQPGARGRARRVAVRHEDGMPMWVEAPAVHGHSHPLPGECWRCDALHLNRR